MFGVVVQEDFDNDNDSNEVNLFADETIGSETQTSVNYISNEDFLEYDLFCRVNP